MTTYTLSHLSDPALLRDLAALLARDRATTASLLAHIGEVDARKLYLAAAHPSMYSYCVHVLRLSEDAAFKRIRVARAARRFPAVFNALAEGRLHLSALVLLASYLTPENADELLAAATHKTRAEIEMVLAERFPRPELLALVEAIPPTGPADAQPELAPGPVSVSEIELVSERSVLQLAPGQVETTAPRARLTPIASRRFALQVTIGQGTHDKLLYAKALLSHQIPSGDLADLLDRALDALIAQLEKRKFAATSKPRPRRRRPTTSPRHVPAHVKRAVWERDGGQCTFASDSGQRCPARAFLEFDHIDEVARGGQASVEGMRLRCRAHNQYAAERTFGSAFMDNKRQEARFATAAARERAAARAQVEDVTPWLRALGLRADEARRAARRCEAIPDAPLEQRVRLALTGFGPGAHSHGREAPRSSSVNEISGLRG